MEKRRYIEQELERLFREWSVRAAVFGAVIFLLIAPLDFISVPDKAVRFLGYRLAVSLALLLIGRLAARSHDPRALRLLGFAAVLFSAAAVELMILDFGGYRSPYTAGMILLGVSALGLIPAGAWFHALLAGTILAVYTLPLLAFTPIDRPRDFFTEWYLFVAVLGAAVFIRHLHRRSIERELGLAHDMAVEELRLAQQIDQRTEQLLCASNEWRATFDSAGEMILLLDEEDRVVKANIAVRDYTGRSFDEILGASAFALFPRWELPRDAHPLAQMRRTGQRTQKEFRVRDRAAWFLMTAEPIRKGSIQEGGAVLTVRDITDLKEMERAVIRARDDWEETFDSIREGITIHDDNFVILRANAAARRLLGRGDEPLEGRRCFEVFHGTNAPIGGCPSRESARTGYATMIDLHEPRLGCYLEITALPRPSGGTIHVVHEISERKGLFDEVAAAAERMQRILERSPFGIFIVNEEFRVEFANPAILAITGYSHEEFVGAFLGSFPACTELGMGQHVEEALGGEPFRIGPAPYRCNRKNVLTMGQFTGLPLVEGGRRKVLVFVEDVTELRRAEEERLRLTALLLQVQKLEAIGTLASGIAHDFNNILLGVIGLTDAAAEQLPATHPAREHLEAVIGAAERGSNLVRQLLAFSRQQDLQTRPVDVRALIGETRKMLLHMLPKNIAFDILGKEALPRVVADPVQLEQVLMNLAINARDAMPQGGILAIETGTAEVRAGDPAHPGVAQGFYVIISVRDTGNGIPPDLRDRIFDPFFTTKGPGGGTGLGLATTYGIVSQHGGAVRVESEVGKGTTFFIYLPALEEGLQV